MLFLVISAMGNYYFKYVNILSKDSTLQQLHYFRGNYIYVPMQTCKKVECSVRLKFVPCKY